MKKGKTVTLLCVAMLAVPIQGALAAAPEAAQKMERMQSGRMDKMHGEKMDSMRATMAKIRATEDPEERARLLEQHLDQMHRRMEEMHKSMGEMMAQMDEQRVETRKLHDHRRMK